MKSVRCFDVNPRLILNYSCKLRPVRAKSSLLFLSFTPVLIPKPIGKFVLLYKFTRGFRKWIFEFDVQVCEIFDEDSLLLTNKGFKILWDCVRSIFPALTSGCPYEGVYEARWVDINKTIAPLLPPTLPTGLFRFAFHFDTHANESIFSLHIDVELKATKEFRTTDFTFLNMG